MSPMAYERGESIFQHLGGWVPSRAVNASDGRDPVSLGLVPLAAAGTEPVERSVSPSPAGVSGYPLPAEPLPAPLPQPTLEVPEAYHGLLRRPPEQALFIDVASGLVWLRGRTVTLTPTEQSEVMASVVRAYERQQQDEITSLRFEFMLPPDPQGTEVREAHDNVDVVRAVPSLAAPQESTDT